MKKNKVDDNTIEQCKKLIFLVEKIHYSEIAYKISGGGVWNNVLLKISTPNKSYYFKKYKELDQIPNYCPPKISVSKRSKIARTIQRIASVELIDKYQIVPSVLAHDRSSFLMDYVEKSKQLYDFISTGEFPKDIITVLPTALAKFHNSTFNKGIWPKELNDSTFKNYKLSLQYSGITDGLSKEKKEIIQKFENEYKNKKLCVVHGDLNSRNILINQEKMISIIDFEQAHLGSPAYDLAFILSEMFISYMQFGQTEETKKNLLKFIKKYLKSLKKYNSDEVAREATNHLAAQIIYRFQGPSAKYWSNYVSNENKIKIINIAIDMIKVSPAPVYEII